MGVSNYPLAFRRKSPWLGTFSGFRFVRRPPGKEAGCVYVVEVIIDVRRGVILEIGGCEGVSVASVMYILGDVIVCLLKKLMSG